MKIIVLHGEDTGKSQERLRKFTDEAKKRGWELLYDEVAATPSLFGTGRLTVIRDYKLVTPKILKSLTKITGTFVIHHTNNLPQTFLKTLPKDTKVEEFKLPKLIWSFLEHLYPGNSDACIKEFHRIIETDPPEFVFSVIAKHFRVLFWTKTDPGSMQYPSWRAGKLKTQSAKFKEGRLEKIIGSLTEIDVNAKTGKGDLVLSLDLLIIKQLE